MGAKSRHCLGFDVLGKSSAANDTTTEQEATPRALTDQTIKLTNYTTTSCTTSA
jgi:hypothetical protein